MDMCLRHFKNTHTTPKNLRKTQTLADTQKQKASRVCFCNKAHTSMRHKKISEKLTGTSVYGGADLARAPFALDPATPTSFVVVHRISRLGKVGEIDFSYLRHDNCCA